MLKTKTLLRAWGKDFPKHLAKKYGDYVGLMCGKLPTSIQKVVIVLDMEHAILDQVIASKPDLVITHHPLIYGTRARVFKADPHRAQLVKTLEKHRIPVYSLHTNFDEGHGGMNDALAEALGLINIHPLIDDPLARGGTLPKPMTVEQFANFARRKFNVPYGLFIAEGRPMISNVALIGGGGARYFSNAQKQGYDLFMSGDAPHHVRRAIVNAKYNYLDLPHEIETIFLPTMQAYLLKLDPTLTIDISLRQTLPILVSA
jgi:dinuclear metal center YbgI/SA1388 family protein